MVKLNGINQEYFLALGAVLFCLGLMAVLIRRNIIMALLGIELMINASVINFLVFNYQNEGVTGHIFALFIIVMATAGLAVALAIALKVAKVNTFAPNN